MNNSFSIVFPGQGSQTVGMLSDIANAFSEVTTTFAQASEVLQYDLWELVAKGPLEKLNETTYTQPALLAASYAIWRILATKQNLKPAFLAGHSLGEYTALVCAQALSFQEAIMLVAARGQYMQEAVANGVGAMAAIVGLSDSEIENICQEVKAEEVLAPANYNSLGQVVIAGHAKAVERAIAKAKEQGAKLAILIPVSVPSHCELMQPAATRLAATLKTITFHTPTLPVISNVDALPYQDSEAIRIGLEKQLYSPVRWVETVQYMIKHGVTDIIECGPGKVLSGLNKRIDKTLRLYPTSEVAALEVVLNSQNERSV